MDVQLIKIKSIVGLAHMVATLDLTRSAIAESHFSSSSPTLLLLRMPLHHPLPRSMASSRDQPRGMVGAGAHLPTPSLVALPASVATRAHLSRAPTKAHPMGDEFVHKKEGPKSRHQAGIYPGGMVLSQPCL